MNTTDCLFCKIIAGEIPCDKVYEDEHTFAFLDISPINPGHTLVIPKEHYVNLFDISEEAMANMGKTITKVAKALEKSLGTDNINLEMNNGTVAGQVVPHAHMHIMPRLEGDGYVLWHGKKYKDGEADKIAELLRNAL